MACFRFIRDDAGYAAPAAFIVAMGLALVGAAVVDRSVGLLRLSRNDLNLMQTEYVLSGAQLTAAATIVRTQQPPPYHWAIATEVGAADSYAEPEQTKLSLTAASRLDDGFFERFGVASPDALRARLGAAAASGLFTDVGALDGAQLWKLCAPQVISYFGLADTLGYTPPVEPVLGPGPEPQSWRIGEVWRISLATPAGWRDQRYMRFTGDASHPAAVVARHLSRGEGDGGRCAVIFANLPAA